MSRIDSYLLEFLIDGTSSNRDAIKKAVAKALSSKYVSSVDWSVTQTPFPHFMLSIRGSLKDLDTCHNRINKKFVNHYSCIRLRDDAGEEIRQQAYPILAHIEQQLRAFINRAMIEVKGFNWWDSLAPFFTKQIVPDKVKYIEKQIGKTKASHHHAVELMYFTDLLYIVTASTQYWPAGKPLSADDLLKILSDCSSLDDLRGKLAEKTRKISIWNEVFARYFDDINKWVDTAKTLTDFVIDVRNKVMHHRPMHLWELQKLQETGQSLDTLLASAATKLSEEERAQALRVSEDWLSALTSTLGELVRPSLKFSDAIGSFWKKQEELSRALGEPGNVIQRFGELLRDQQKQVALGVRLAGQSVAPLAAFSSSYIGNTDSFRFHRPLCRHVNQILPEKQIRFANRDEALAKGYVPCRTCKP